jgi:hypothetical protein
MESRCRYTRINGARCTMPGAPGLDFETRERKPPYIPQVEGKK